jgi:hypothetical protein
VSERTIEDGSVSDRDRRDQRVNGHDHHNLCVCYHDHRGPCVSGHDHHGLYVSDQSENGNVPTTKINSTSGLFVIKEAYMVVMSTRSKHSEKIYGKSYCADKQKLTRVHLWWL